MSNTDASTHVGVQVDSEFVEAVESQQVRLEDMRMMMFVMLTQDYGAQAAALPPANASGAVQGIDIL
jgi:hypothetical protein